MSETSKKRKLLSPFEWIIFFIAIGILGYIVLDKDGGDFSIMKRTETIEIIDQPHAEGSKSKARPYTGKYSDDSVESVLKELADQFSEEKSTKKSGSTLVVEETTATISKEELKLYEELKQNDKISDKIRSAGDWFKTLKSAHNTYQKLRSVFSEASGEAPEALEEDGLESIWENAKRAENIYSELEKTFNISEEQSREFARRGKKTLSDWAKFIEESQN